MVSQDHIKLSAMANSKKTAQNYVTEARKEKEKQQEEIRQEIQFLPKIVAPVRNQKTISMISDLSDKRRNKHLLYLEEVESIMETLMTMKDNSLSTLGTELTNEVDSLKVDYE